MTEKTTLGRRIQEGRKAAELSQEALGERLGVSRQAVSKWEADAAIPELENLIAMSRIFGITVGCLLGVEEAAKTDREDQTQAPEPDWSHIETLAAKYSRERRERERKWSRRLAVLGGAAGVCLLALALAVAFHIYSAQQQLERLQSQVDSLRGQSTVVVQPSEEKGELASSQVSITGFDLEAETMTLALSAVPAEKKTDTTAVFSAKLADGTELTQEAESGTAFTTSDWTVPMSDSVDLAVILTSGDQVRTVPLESLSAGREDFLPQVYGDWLGSWSIGGPVKLGTLNLQIFTPELFYRMTEPPTLERGDLCLYRGTSTRPEQTLPVESVEELGNAMDPVEVSGDAYTASFILKGGETMTAALRLRDTTGQECWYILGMWTCTADGIDSLIPKETLWTPGTLPPTI